jgi:hypothetical protein
MAGKQARQKRRTAPGRRRWRVPAPILALAGILAVLAGAAALKSTGPAGHGHDHGPVVHPAPRADVNAAMIVAPGRYVGYPRIAEVYRQVAAIPEVIDGLYCYCDCRYHADHYSLLDCFRDDHGAGCDICMTQAALAYRMTGEGRSLDEIRETTDRLYGR